MAIEKRRKTDAVLTPFTDPAFRRSAVHFDNIEFQRRFEQNLIRYDLKNGSQVEQTINNIVSTTTGGGGGGESTTGCYWTKEGSNLAYYDGNVGVKCHPTGGADFEVMGGILIEARGDQQPFLEIRNWSDTEYDPVVQFASGATPVKKFTMGLDDSDSDA